LLAAHESSSAGVAFPVDRRKRAQDNGAVKVSSAQKSAVLRDWAGELRQLGRYGQNKLYQVVGPIVLGVEILPVTGMGWYRPHMVCFPLWKEDAKACLAEPTVLEQAYDERGLQLDVPYEKHAKFFGVALAGIRRKFPNLQGSASLTEVFAFLDRQFSDILVSSAPVAQMKLTEMKVLSAAYAGDARLGALAWEQVQRLRQDWPPEFFEWKHGPLEPWLEALSMRSQARDALRQQVLANQQSKLLVRLPYVELRSSQSGTTV
jgi:hypothetical protein